ncbi:Nucleotidyltransferase [Microstroma glucosiphilum]|uniref:DNA polymerase n=1 Tax=Pseudomicrostroma glucosiphilum TaxID=1684307 RepID=A0A316TWR5_9BASI|nr:Nucleotidyltransferase [Pseudomicrostroma glucosiphilum]PWN17889.1 Nucleotidyltransferase [Pseudomicrostroma glucosiphilum]
MPLSSSSTSSPGPRHRLLESKPVAPVRIASPASAKNAHILLSGDRTQAQPSFRVLSQAVRCFVLPDKLTQEERQAVYDEVVTLGALAATIEYTNLILTSLRAPKRVIMALKRERNGQLTDDWFAKIPILHLDWLAETARRRIMQDYTPYRIPTGMEDTDVPSAVAKGKQPARPAMKREPSSFTEDEEAVGESSEEDVLHTTSKKKIKTERRASPQHSYCFARETSPPTLPSSHPSWVNSEYCCQRPTPLRSVHNQSLVDELEVIRKQRALTSQQWSERSYSGCLSAIKAYPAAICSKDLKTVRDLKGVGKKMIGLIEQFCDAGHIVEAQQIRNDAANAILFDFMDLYGVGPVAARALYEEGCRTFEDVIAHGKSLATQLEVADCYRILPDLKTKIPRKEVEEIARLLLAELNVILPGTFIEIVGGYRRGKPMSNDVDIVISNDHADFSKRLDVINRLLTTLKRRGLMSYSVNVTNPSDGYETSGFVDIAEIVFLPPVTPGIIPVSRHRRVDLVFCSPKVYGACVVGWTGSRNFEKDIRRWATRGGFKFHSSGLVDTDTGELMETRNEQDVFRMLRLPFMPPELRNCDA